MLIVDTENDSGRRIIRRTGTPLDLLCVYLVEDWDNHDRGRCLYDPPTWTYWIIGGHPRYSLGGILWHAGRATHRRVSQLPIAALD